MKTLNLFCMLVVLLLAVGFSSCFDEDNKHEFTQLAGKWAVTEPKMTDNYVMSYTFKANKICEIYMGNPLSNGKPINCTYTISKDDQLITIVDIEGLYPTEKYYIIELAFGKMKWKMQR